MFWSLAVFPTLLAVNHLALLQWASFYPAFSFREKCEYLAWINTVFFQTTFTVLRPFLSPVQLAGYFMAYAVHDTIHLTFYERSPLFYVHHAFVIAYAYALFWIPYADALTLVNAAAILEASNILLGIVWLMNRSGGGAHLATKILGGLALVIYLVFRNVLFPSYLYLYAPRFVQVMLSVFVPMNVYWSWKLLMFYSRLLKKSGKERLE